MDVIAEWQRLPTIKKKKKKMANGNHSLIAASSRGHLLARPPAHPPGVLWDLSTTAVHFLELIRQVEM